MCKLSRWYHHISAEPADEFQYVSYKVFRSEILDSLFGSHVLLQFRMPALLFCGPPQVRHLNTTFDSSYKLHNHGMSWLLLHALINSMNLLRAFRSPLRLLSCGVWWKKLLNCRITHQKASASLQTRTICWMWLASSRDLVRSLLALWSPILRVNVVGI